MKIKLYLFPAIGFVFAAAVITSVLSNLAVLLLPNAFSAGDTYSVRQNAYFFAEVIPTFALSLFASVLSQRWAKVSNVAWNGVLFGVVEVLSFFCLVWLCLPIVGSLLPMIFIGDYVGLAIINTFAHQLPLLFYGAIIIAPVLLYFLRGDLQTSARSTG